MIAHRRGRSGGVTPSGFFASPTGLAGNAGTAGSPWDLATALAGGPRGQVAPGDTIWLRAGTYGTGAETITASVSGSSGAPVVVKPFAGEHVILNLVELDITGANVWYMNDSLTALGNFEITRTTTSPADGTDLIRMAEGGNGVKLIHLVVHDAAGVGISPQSETADHEVYGCVVYNNGRSHVFDGTGAAGHGIYAHGTTTAGQTRKVTNNIVFDNVDYGIHCFADTGNLNNLDVESNICLQNSVSPGLGQDMLVGGQTALTNAIVSNNVVMRTDKQGTATIGYLQYSDPGVPANNGVVQSNYFAGTVSLGNWGGNTLAFSLNTIVATQNQALKALFQGTAIAAGSWTMNGNTYATLAPAGFGLFAADVGPAGSETTYATFAAWQTAIGKDATSTYTAADNLGTKTFLVPSAKLAGRGHLAIHNPTSAATVNVDISSVVTSGHPYAIYDVYDIWGTPILSGTYAGGTVAVPMTGTGKTPPAVIGRADFTPTNGHPTMGAYVVLQTG